MLQVEAHLHRLLGVFGCNLSETSPRTAEALKVSSLENNPVVHDLQMASLAADFDVETLWTEKDQAAVDKWRAAKEKQYAVEVRDASGGTRARDIMARS